MEPIKLPLLEVAPVRELEDNSQPPQPSPEKDGQVKSATLNLAIKAPETKREIIFEPRQTVRSPKWSYPYPYGFIVGSGEDKAATMAEIVNLLGEQTTKDFLQDSLTRHCQALWKEAVTNGPKENVTPEDYFITFFFDINRRTGEDTPEKIAKQIATIFKTIKARKDAGAPIEELLGLKKEFLALKEKQDKLTLDLI